MSHGAATGPRPMANAVVRPQQKFPINLAHGAEAGDQRVLQGSAGRGGLAGAG